MFFVFLSVAVAPDIQQKFQALFPGYVTSLQRMYKKHACIDSNTFQSQNYFDSVFYQLLLLKINIISISYLYNQDLAAVLLTALTKHR